MLAPRRRSEPRFLAIRYEGADTAGRSIDGIRIVATGTLMRGAPGQQRLARATLALAAALRCGD